MKYAFSTLACPDWEWSDILAAASDLGFDGIELRGIGSEIYLPKISLFGENKIEKTMAGIKRLNLKISCLASSAYLFDKSLADSAKCETEEFIVLASKIGAPFVRVLADKDPAPGVVDENSVEENLRALLPIAEANNVTLLVETNGVFADSKRLAELCKRIGHKNLGVLWDIHHPYRYFNESCETTIENLGDYIRYVHVKDSIMNNGRAEYRMLGDGDVPVDEALSLLKKRGYDGFVTLEWVRRWDMNLEDPGIALPHFLSAVK